MDIWVKSKQLCMCDRLITCTNSTRAAETNMVQTDHQKDITLLKNMFLSQYVS